MPLRYRTRHLFLVTTIIALLLPLLPVHRILVDVCAWWKGGVTEKMQLTEEQRDYEATLIEVESIVEGLELPETDVFIGYPPNLGTAKSQGDRGSEF